MTKKKRDEDRPVDHNLVAHIKAQIAKDPEAYANLKKLEIVAEKVAKELNEEEA